MQALKGQMNTDHPQYGARQLLKLVGATPARLDRGQTKVTDLHRQILMEENIWAHVRSRKRSFCFRHHEPTGNLFTLLGYSHGGPFIAFPLVKMERFHSLKDILSI